MFFPCSKKKESIIKKPFKKKKGFLKAFNTEFNNLDTHIISV